MISLKKYKRVYKLRVKPGSGKPLLLQAIQDHHQSFKVDEVDIVSKFLNHVKAGRLHSNEEEGKGSVKSINGRR